jgi:peptidoglycan/xylan/chitin deacetylase (PgdA/CDA1 family)
VWPKELWHALVTELLRDFQVIEVGTEALFSADDFGAGFHAWSGTTSLADFVWTVGQGTVFVGPPSGGMHLANAFQVPSVILYGGYESPLGHQYPRTRALYRQVPCAPCWLRENCPYDLKCLRMISTADVLTAVKELVAERQAHPLPALPPQGRPRLAVARRARSRNLREKTRELLEACARPMYAGVGSIVVLHRIVPREECSGQPSNRALEITVEDLRAILEWVRQTGLEPVSLDAVPERLAKPRRDKFITLTLDDGYRDNLLHAVPLFREYDVPFTVNLASGFMARTASAWWHALEQMLLARAAVEFSWKGEDYRMASDSPWARESAFGKLAGMIRAQGLKQREELLAVLAAATGHDPLDDTSKLMMTWDEARQLAAEPLATIGAHTVGHYSLNMLSDAEVRKEMLDSKTEIEAQLGREVRHFAYPFGGRSAVNEREFQIARECGFKTMLTTRIANLFPEHGRSLDRLPRLVVSGNYPAVSNLSLQESGLASAWQWKFRRLVTT